MQNDTKPKQCNDIYKSLCVYSLESKKIPIDKLSFIPDRNNFDERVA